MKNWRYRNHFFILLNPHYINLTQNSSSTICFSEILQFKIDNYHLKSLSVNHQFAAFLLRRSHEQYALNDFNCPLDYLIFS